MKPHGIDIDNLKEGGAPPSGVERREFLKIGLVITGVFAGGTMFSLASNIGRALASPEDVYKNYPYKPHYSMVIRQDRCIDCERCKQACRATNHVPDYGFRTTILEKDVPGAIGQKREFIPMLCMQCNNPPCVRACPTKASYKDKTNGIVLIDDKRCIGCKTCMLACPYNARYFDDEKHAVDKCNFCFDTRLSKGEKLTACAAICPAHARVFGDLSDPGSEPYRLIHQILTPVWVLRPSVGTKPSVFYTKG